MLMGYNSFHEIMERSAPELGVVLFVATIIICNAQKTATPLKAVTFLR
jgi:hypothetical protein